MGKDNTRQAVGAGLPSTGRAIGVQLGVVDAGERRSSASLAADNVNVAIGSNSRFRVHSDWQAVGAGLPGTSRAVGVQLGVVDCVQRAAVIKAADNVRVAVSRN